jgi:tetratricopeptide (TPR) repeat protein
LIDARADKHLWANTFERSSRDVLALQAELASAIAREVNVPDLERAVTADGDPERESRGARCVSQGPILFQSPKRREPAESNRPVRRSVRLSPTFAPAFSGLSDAYLWAGYNEGFLTATEARPKARAAAEKAVTLDDNSAEAHRRAFALNPNYAFAYDQFGMALAFQGRFQEAIAEGTRAIELDPLSPQVLIDASVAFMFQRNSEAAKRLGRWAAELDPTYFFPVMIDGWTDLEMGKFREAIPALKKAKAMEAPPFVTAYLAFAHGAAGDRASALAEFADLKKMSRDGTVLPFNLALVHLGLGDRVRALDNLERAPAADSQMMPWIGRDAIFDSIRSQPRFAALLNNMGVNR